MASHCHSEHHHGLKRKRSFGDRAFDFDDYLDVGPEIELGKDWWTYLSCTDSDYNIDIAHNDAIVIAVDGATRNNGKPWARSGAGIFFHIDNHSWNTALELGSDYNANQKAELRAGLEALRLAARMRKLNPSWTKSRRLWRKGPQRRLRRVIIKADSEYLVKGMTDWIHKWRDNGYENCRGLPVANAELFKELDSAVEALNDMDVEVQFWHVRREHNKMADCLANAALDDISATEAIDRYLASSSDSDQ